MSTMLLLRTKSGIVEMPVNVIGEKPKLLPPALWTRLLELVCDWTKGRPEKPITDILVPDSLFRTNRDRVERFLYTRDAGLVDGAAGKDGGTSLASKLETIDWHRMVSLGLVQAGNEPADTIDLLEHHPGEVLVKMRKMLEHVVNVACSFHGEEARNDLAAKIKVLEKACPLPPTVRSAMHSIRIAGNQGAHETVGTPGSVDSYVKATMLHFIHVVEWFLNDTCSRGKGS